MTTLAGDPDVVAKAIARLTDLYRTKPRVRALVTTLAERFQTEDSVDLSLYLNQWIGTASAGLLNAIGELVGEPRLGRSDDLYRLWIRARIRINRTQGTVADSYHLVRLIAGQDIDVIYTPTPPAAYTIEVNGTDINPTELYNLLDAVRPAGVEMRLLYTPVDTANIFTLSTTDTLVPSDFDKGFGAAANPLVGGRLRGVI